MANRMKSVNGVAVEMTDAEEAARTAEEAEATRPRTPAERNAAVTKTLGQHFGPDASEDVQVRNLMAADVLMGIDNRLTKTTALVQVRANYEAHLRAIRGL